MTETPSKPTAADIPPAVLTRYQVMAIVTGSFLLLVFVGVFIDHVIKPDNQGLLTTITAVQTAHGFIYMVYLVTVVDLWIKAKWTWGRLVLMMFGGVIPFLSFFVERRITREYREATA